VSKTAPTLLTRAPYSGTDEPCAAAEFDTPLDSGAVAGWVERLGVFRRDVSDAERIDQIRELERLKEELLQIREARYREDHPGGSVNLEQ